MHRLHDAGRVYCRSAGRGPDGSSQTTGGSGPASDPFSHDKHTEAGAGSELRPPPPPQGAREGSPEQGGHWGREGQRGEGGSRDLGGREGTAAPPRKGPRDSRASGTCRPGGAAEPLPGQGPVSKERGALQPAEVPFTPVVAGLRHKWDTVISFALPGLPLQHAHTHRHTCRGNPQEGSGG